MVYSLRNSECNGVEWSGLDGWCEVRFAVIKVVPGVECEVTFGLSGM